MKTPNCWMVIPTTLALLLTAAGVASSDTPAIQLAKKFPTDPIVATGISGGAIKTKDCGSIAQTPNQVVTITQGQSIEYMRMSVNADGDPTLIVKGPGGRFCVLADKASGENPQMSGYWSEGVYSIYIGDRAGGHHPYKLSLTQKRS